MTTAAAFQASIDDLLKVKEKSELIGGRIVEGMPTGPRPGRVALRIARSLDDHAERSGEGVAVGDNVGFVVPAMSSGRESFSSDAAYFAGPLPGDDMKFVEGAPPLAVEVRSEGDNAPAAERAMARKRADYFAAGTAVVWDVDPGAELVHVYRIDMPDTPTSYGRGQVADAEPAVPGWRPRVNDLLPVR